MKTLLKCPQGTALGSFVLVILLNGRCKNITQHLANGCVQVRGHDFAFLKQFFINT
jgi:hypothetical protein